MNNIVQIMFSLIAYEVFGKEIPIETRKQITPDVLQSLYELSKKHDLAHLIFDALYKNGFNFSGDDFYNKFQTEQITAIYRYQQQNFELNRVRALFEENLIPFLPLKGAIIKDYYPEPWMRTSCDVDILVKEQDLEKAKAALIDKLNYEYKITSEHDIEFFSQSGMHLELHYKLSESDLISAEEIWDTAILKETTQQEYLMTGEYFVLYHLFHMFKHFVNGGCGVKPFVDLYILKTKFHYDPDKLLSMCKKYKLDVFYEKMLMLMNVWFENAEYEQKLYDLEIYILTGGVYGNKVNRIAVKQNENGGKIGLIFSRLFPPTEYLQKLFKKSEIKKWQYPYFAFKRMLRMLDKEKYNKISNELSVNNSVTKSEAEKVTDILEYIGL